MLLVHHHDNFCRSFSILCSGLIFSTMPLQATRAWCCASFLCRPSFLYICTYSTFFPCFSVTTIWFCTFSMVIKSCTLKPCLPLLHKSSPVLLAVPHWIFILSKLLLTSTYGQLLAVFNIFWPLLPRVCHTLGCEYYLNLNNFLAAFLEISSSLESLTIKLLIIKLSGCYLVARLTSHVLLCFYSVD